MEKGMKLIRALTEWHKSSALIAGLSLVIAIGAVDYLTGYELSLSVLYLIPVSLVSWTTGRWWGLVAALLCAVIWTTADHLAGQTYSSLFYIFWHAASRTGVFGAIALLFAALRRSVDHEKSLARIDHLTGAANKRAFEELVAAATEAKPKARIEGVLVQEQVDGAVAEMIIGVSRDPVLGPAVLLGTGGVLAELFDDVAVCPLPLDRADVSDMLESLRGRALLSGWRGRPRADRKALLDAVMAVARLATACGEDLAELDLNPVVVRSSGVLCVDSLVVMA